MIVSVKRGQVNPRLQRFNCGTMDSSRYSLARPFNAFLELPCNGNGNEFHIPCTIFGHETLLTDSQSRQRKLKVLLVINSLLNGDGDEQ